jgi:hypothetical protein
MTEQEQQLLQAILRIDHASAPELSMALVKGIDQQVKRFHKKMLSNSLEFYRGERNHEGRIALNNLIAWMGREKEQVGLSAKDVATMVAFHHFHPQQADNYLEFNEPLGAFEPQHAEERMQEAIPLFIEGIASGDWQLKEYPEELRGNREVALAAIKEDYDALRFASVELKSDKEVVLEAVKQSGYALEYASEALQNDPELIALAEKTKK